MSNRIFGIRVQRIVALVLALILMTSFCPVSAHAQETFSSVPIIIDEELYFVDMRFVGNSLYCRADQWAQAAGCLWNCNEDLNKVSFYYDTPVILCSFGQSEYVKDSNILWVPFGEVAKETGIFFSGVESGSIRGYRVKPLAIFYKDMDRMFAIEKYRISKLINELGLLWAGISTTSRFYAILSSGFISGVMDTVSGKMEQDIYNEIFIELLKTDESLLGALTGAGKELTRLGKAINMIQKSLDEDGAFVELLKKAGFDETEIREIVWSAAQGAYGDKYLNDLSDLYEADKASNFLKILGTIDDFAVSIEADAHTIFAIQEVFRNSSPRIQEAARRAITMRTDGVLGVAAFSVKEAAYHLLDLAVKELEDLYEEYYDIGSLDKLLTKSLTWVYDQSLSLTEKSDAVMYSEAHSLIQLELASYYWKHCDDVTADNGLLMHSVALLYLRSCLASWKLFEFDNSLETSIQNAKTTIEVELSNLMSYTEEELLQNGTSEECAQAIIDFVNSLPINSADQAELFNDSYWIINFGQTLGSQYLGNFSSDGTFAARSAGSGEMEYGSYTYRNGWLTLNFAPIGSSVIFHGNADGFSSWQEYEMQVGREHYWLEPTDDIVFFENGYSQPEPTVPSLETLSDGEHDGLLSHWSEDTMTLELWEYQGWGDYGPIYQKTGQIVKVDISGAQIWLEGVWMDDGQPLAVESIDQALDTTVWEGSTTVREYLVGNVIVYFVVKNGSVTDVTILYMA